MVPGCLRVNGVLLFKKEKKGVGGPLEHLQVSVVEDLYIKQVTHSLVVIQVEAVVQTCVRREKYDQDGEKKKRLNDGNGFSGPHNLQTSVLQSGQRGLQITEFPT